MNRYVVSYLTHLGFGNMVFEIESNCLDKNTFEAILLKIKSEEKVDEVGIINVIKLEDSDEGD